MRTFLEPCDDRLVLQPLTRKGQTEGGLIIPESAEEAPMFGRIFGVGPGKPLQDGTRGPMPFKLGELVLFGRFTAAPIEVHRETWLILKASDVLAIVREEELPATGPAS